MHAENVALISEEGNDVADRIAGLMPDPEEDPRVLVYQRGSLGAFTTAELDQLRRTGPRRLAELTGISVRRLRDILQGKANPRCAILWKLLAALDAFGRNVPAEDTDQHR